MQALNESWLVTGGLGCIGAWTVLRLVRDGAPVVAFSRGSDDHRLRLVASSEELERITLVRGDITDLDAVARVLDERRITHVVHLAALQAPFCRADPPLGAQVNVTGTVNVLEAARRHGLATTLAYASSAAVFDARGEPVPKTVYGVYKVANEWTARVYWQDHGLASIGLRPLVVYGPGRDRGMTAGPTEAIAAAVRGEPYRISFGGRTQLHYAPDVARAFLEAAQRPPSGAEVLSLGGPDSSMAEIVATIAQAVPGADIAYEDVPLPFPPRLPGPVLDVEWTPLARGIRETVEVLRRAPDR